MASSNQVTPDTLVTLKVVFQDANKRFKLPLKELGANTLPDRVSCSSCVRRVALSTIFQHQRQTSMLEKEIG